MEADMMDKKGKPGVAVMIALGKMKGKGVGGHEDLSVESAREILDAIKADDEKRFASLLKDFIYACQNEEDDSGECEDGENCGGKKGY
jgi:hypothetical protein